VIEAPMLKSVFFLALGILAGMLIVPALLEWFIQLTREPHDQWAPGTDCADEDVPVVSYRDWLDGIFEGFGKK
jgi:hypothetical protein